VHQITHDHTLVAEMVRRGALQTEEVAHHRLRNVITNVVGGTEAGVNVEAHALKIDAGDRLLLCSDGLTERLTNEVIAATLRAEPDPQAACTKLVSQANDAGGRDNITVLSVRFETKPGHSLDLPEADQLAMLWVRNDTGSRFSQCE
jgi:protein phosphatase